MNDIEEKRMREVRQKYRRKNRRLYRKLQDGKYFQADLGVDDRSDYMSIDMFDFSVEFCPIEKLCVETEDKSIALAMYVLKTFLNKETFCQLMEILNVLEEFDDGFEGFEIKKTNQTIECRLIAPFILENRLETREGRNIVRRVTEYKELLIDILDEVTSEYTKKYKNTTCLNKNTVIEEEKQEKGRTRGGKRGHEGGFQYKF